MIAFQQSPKTLKLSPENETEALTLESWSYRNAALAEGDLGVKVESTQRNMDGRLTGLILVFGSER